MIQTSDDEIDEYKSKEKNVLERKASSEILKSSDNKIFDIAVKRIKTDELPLGTSLQIAVSRTRSVDFTDKDKNLKALQDANFNHKASCSIDAVLKSPSSDKSAAEINEHGCKKPVVIEVLDSLLNHIVTDYIPDDAESNSLENMSSPMEQSTLEVPKNNEQGPLPQLRVPLVVPKDVESVHELNPPSCDNSNEKPNEFENVVNEKVSDSDDSRPNDKCCINSPGSVLNEASCEQHVLKLFEHILSCSRFLLFGSCKNKFIHKNIISHSISDKWLKKPKRHKPDEFLYHNKTAIRSAFFDVLSTILQDLRTKGCFNLLEKLVLEDETINFTCRNMSDKFLELLEANSPVFDSFKDEHNLSFSDILSKEFFELPEDEYGNHGQYIESTLEDISDNAISDCIFSNGSPSYMGECSTKSSKCMDESSVEFSKSMDESSVEFSKSMDESLVGFSKSMDESSVEFSKSMEESFVESPRYIDESSFESSVELPMESPHPSEEFSIESPKCNEESFQDSSDYLENSFTSPKCIDSSSVEFPKSKEDSSEKQATSSHSISNVSIVATNSPKIIKDELPQHHKPALRSMKTLVVNKSEVKTRHKNALSIPYESSIGCSKEEIVERAKHEAHVMQRISELKKKGLWSLKRLPKSQETPRDYKTHWDYLLEEMTWLCNDFSQERKWKKAAAKKCARMITKYFQEKETKAEKAEREKLARLKRVASTVCKEVRTFWANIEKLAEYKTRIIIDAKKKKALDTHLNYIVDQADKYSSWLTEGLSKSIVSPGKLDSLDNESDDNLEEDQDLDDYCPSDTESDNEETIAKEEEEEMPYDEGEEIKLLKEESDLPIEDLLKQYSVDENAEDSIEGKRIDSGTVKDHETKLSANLKLANNEDDISDDPESYSTESEREDDEETIAKEEELEPEESHEEELKELQDEGEISIEELLKKYKNIYDNNSDGESSNQSMASMEEEEEESTSEDEASLTDLAVSDKDEKDTDNKIEDNSLFPSKVSNTSSKDITDIAAIAESFQPKGNTMSTTQVCTKVPFLLKHQLREYQHIGLDWLNAMYEQNLNGILADEMGLGKTIQTIALLAHLACEKGIWGPHLIVVPTSVMLNWEIEFKKWLPAFKVLTYYGTPKERRNKRVGWTKPNVFHVCITSYKLVVQDNKSFRRKHWVYLILDEAQHIKNFKSQRWQMLLSFQSSHRLLLTGTPLQNNLMELWSLMHFLMPSVFESQKFFKEWFVNPFTGMIDGNQEYNEGLIKRLHKVLRPFLLRRLKSEVEKQLPKKYEHVVMCRLSKRQRYLYDDFMSQAVTKETLSSGSFMSVISVLMQLRKVCNHPNLFEPRAIQSPLMTEGLTHHTASLVSSALDYDPYKHVNLLALNVLLADIEMCVSAYAAHRTKTFQTPSHLIENIDNLPFHDVMKPPVGKIKLHITSSRNPAANPRASLLSPRTRLALSPNPRIIPSPFNAITNSKYVATTPLAQDSSRLVTRSEQGHQKQQGDYALSLQSSGVLPQMLKIDRNPAASTLNRSPIIPPNITTNASGFPINNNKPIGRVAPLNVQNSLNITGNSASSSAKSPFVPASTGSSHSQIKIETSVATPNEEDYSEFIIDSIVEKLANIRNEKLKCLGQINNLRCSACPVYGNDLIKAVSVCNSVRHSYCGSNDFCHGFVNCLNAQYADENQMYRDYWYYTQYLNYLIATPEVYAYKLEEIIKRFVFVVPSVSTPPIQMHTSHPPPSKSNANRIFIEELNSNLSDKCALLYPVISNMSSFFPELRLIEYDCGKLQRMAVLLRDLKTEHHRVLIFTQMSRMLDILEQFLSYQGHTYLRLDGSTKIEMRQALMERFNGDPKIFCFILSTRSGGVGVNLTGADTVIFYDSDWNPTMDAQAQDRCHRIGQTRDVHIYRLISEMTVEENILKKANQKRLLGDLAIEGGNFTTAFFKKKTLHELFGLTGPELSVSDILNVTKDVEKTDNPKYSEDQLEQALGMAEDESDLNAAKIAKTEAEAELIEFDESVPFESFDQDEDEKTERGGVPVTHLSKLQKIIDSLSPLEQYALEFYESCQDSESLQELKQTEEEIEAHKSKWELDRLKALTEEEQKRTRKTWPQNNEDSLVCSSSDSATKQVPKLASSVRLKRAHPQDTEEEPKRRSPRITCKTEIPASSRKALFKKPLHNGLIRKLSEGTNKVELRNSKLSSCVNGTSRSLNGRTKDRVIKNIRRRMKYNGLMKRKSILVSNGVVPKLKNSLKLQSKKESDTSPKPFSNPSLVIRTRHALAVETKKAKCEQSPETSTANDSCDLAEQSNLQELVSFKPVIV